MEQFSVNELINHIQDQMFSKINIDFLGEKAVKTLNLYNEEMTRFLLDVEDAIDLILNAFIL